MNTMKSVFVLAPVLICILMLSIACSAPPLEEKDGGWVRLNGTPSEDNPYVEIGCAYAKNIPTLTINAGSDTAKDSEAWTVTVGGWSTTDMWEWKDFPGFRDGATRRPGRPLEFEIFERIVKSEAGNFTITMGETYTFPLLEDDVRARLNNRFPESCYIKPGPPTPTPNPTTLQGRYRAEGEALHAARPPEWRWADGSHWLDGFSHEFPTIPLKAGELRSESMSCIQAEALELAIFPHDIADSDTWHTQANASEIALEWETRHARMLYGDSPRRIQWLNQVSFADWCGEGMQPAQ